MTTYIIRRLFQMIPVALLVMTLVFIIFRLIPGDPVSFILGADPDPEAIAALNRQLGLDQPIIVQYILWMGNVLRGDLGVSYVDHQPVVSLILHKFPATVELAVVSILLGTILGVPAGLISALKQDSWIDALVRFFGLLGFCTPRYWLAILLVIVFSLGLKLIPPAGYVPLNENVGKNLHYLILPVVTMALPIAAEQMRFLRSSMLEVIRQDYIRTAHAKGLTSRTVVLKHALKNALIPFVTILGLQFGFSLGGTVIVEQITAWPGIGWLTLQSINIRDYAVVQGVVLFTALIFLFVNLVVDIGYTFLDPRIRY
jgi:peptide/nickel transport system permease protein